MKHHVHYTYKTSLESISIGLPQAKAEGMGRRLSLSPELVDSFFEEAMVGIVKDAEEVLARQTAISVIYMVGGFSASPLLQARVTSALGKPGRVRIVVMERPGLAIVSMSRVCLKR